MSEPTIQQDTYLTYVRYQIWLCETALKYDPDRVLVGVGSYKDLLKKWKGLEYKILEKMSEEDDDTQNNLPTSEQIQEWE